MDIQHTTPIRRNLDDIGMAFVREQLSDGGVLSGRLSEHLNQGVVWEYSMKEHSNPVLEELKSGGTASPDELSALREKYISFFTDYLKSDTTHILLFENQLFKLSDPYMGNRQNAFELEGCTYLYFPQPGEDLTLQTVAESLSSASNYPYLMLATGLFSQQQLPVRRGLASSAADELVAQTKHVLVGAHDGEGYVVWSRS